MILLVAWLVMLADGAAHDSLDPRIPAFGYVTILVLLVILALASVVMPRGNGGADE